MARPYLQEEELEEFRELLCAHAMELIAQDGFDSFSMRRLSKQVGCSHAKAYRYYANKEELLTDVRTRAFTAYREVLEGRLQGVKGFEERLHVLAMAYVQYAKEQPAAFHLMFGLAQPNTTDQPVLMDAIKAAWGVFYNIVEQAIEAGVLQGETKEVTNLFWAGMHGVATLELAGKLIMGRSQEALAESMFWSLLRAHQPARTTEPKG